MARQAAVSNAALALVCLLVLVALQPSWWVPVLIANLLYALVIYALRFGWLPAAGTPVLRSAERAAPSVQPPFFSIHLPVCREPPDLVLRTLACLEAIRYPRYQVIVISNNTRDPSLWQPLEAFCRDRPRFVFRHEPSLNDYKAGALNLALQMTSVEAEWILTVDADYCVRPDILDLAVARSGDADYLQFPQAYYNVPAGRRPLERELEHFFTLYMTHANSQGCPLLTGTLSFVRKASLKRIGGWSSKSITEDAQTGLDLVCSGLNGTYVDRVAGRGLLPGASSALRRQRQRWAYGNAQTLGSLLRPGTGLPLMRRLSLLLQLTAWHEFLMLPVLCLVSLAIGHLVRPFDASLPLWTAGISIVSLLAFNFAFLLVKLRRVHGLSSIVRQFLVHQGVAWETNVSWFEALLGRPRGFLRTTKFPLIGEGHLSRPMLILLALQFGASVYFVDQGYAGAMVLFLIGQFVLLLGQLELARVFAHSASAVARGSREARP